MTSDNLRKIFPRLFFDLWYIHRPPWDTGIVPPEVQDLIRVTPPGRALDLGCGSGTSSLALAAAGWTVTGVDFSSRAIRMAKRKAKAASRSIDFRVGDVAHLHLSLFSTTYDLILDIGCFHGLTPEGKTAYLEQLTRLLAPGGAWLLYAHCKTNVLSKHGVSEADLANAEKFLTLSNRQDGTDRKVRLSAWFWFSNR